MGLKVVRNDSSFEPKLPGFDLQFETFPELTEQSKFAYVIPNEYEPEQRITGRSCRAFCDELGPSRIGLHRRWNGEHAPAGRDIRRARRPFLGQVILPQLAVPL
jgi:hypothetical protein